MGEFQVGDINIRPLHPQREIFVPPMWMEAVHATYESDNHSCFLSAYMTVTFPGVSAGVTKKGNELKKRLSITLCARAELRHDGEGGWEIATDQGGSSRWVFDTALRDGTIHFSHYGAWQIALRRAVEQMFQHISEEEVLETEVFLHESDRNAETYIRALTGCVSSLLLWNTLSMGLAARFEQ